MVDLLLKLPYNKRKNIDINLKKIKESLDKAVWG